MLVRGQQGARSKPTTVEVNLPLQRRSNEENVFDDNLFENVSAIDPIEEPSSKMMAPLNLVGIQSKRKRPSYEIERTKQLSGRNLISMYERPLIQQPASLINNQNQNQNQTSRGNFTTADASELTTKRSRNPSTHILRLSPNPTILHSEPHKQINQSSISPVVVDESKVIQDYKNIGTRNSIQASRGQSRDFSNDTSLLSSIYESLPHRITEPNQQRNTQNYLKSEKEMTHQNSQQSLESYQIPFSITAFQLKQKQLEEKRKEIQREREILQTELNERNQPQKEKITKNVPFQIVTLQNHKQPVNLQEEQSMSISSIRLSDHSEINQIRASKEFPSIHSARNQVPSSQISSRQHSNSQHSPQQSLLKKPGSEKQKRISASTVKFCSIQLNIDKHVSRDENEEKEKRSARLKINSESPTQIKKSSNLNQKLSTDIIKEQQNLPQPNPLPTLSSPLEQTIPVSNVVNSRQPVLVVDQAQYDIATKVQEQIYNITGERLQVCLVNNPTPVNTHLSNQLVLQKPEEQASKALNKIEKTQSLETEQEQIKQKPLPFVDISDKPVESKSRPFQNSPINPNPEQIKMKPSDQQKKTSSSFLPLCFACTSVDTVANESSEIRPIQKQQTQKELNTIPPANPRRAANKSTHASSYQESQQTDRTNIIQQQTSVNHDYSEYKIVQHKGELKTFNKPVDLRRTKSNAFMNSASQFPSEIQSRSNQNIPPPSKGRSIASLHSLASSRQSMHSPIFRNASNQNSQNFEENFCNRCCEFILSNRYENHVLMCKIKKPDNREGKVNFLNEKILKIAYLIKRKIPVEHLQKKDSDAKIWNFCTFMSECLCVLASDNVSVESFFSTKDDLELINQRIRKISENHNLNFIGTKALLLVLQKADLLVI